MRTGRRFNRATRQGVQIPCEAGSGPLRTNRLHQAQIIFGLLSAIAVSTPIFGGEESEAARREPRGNYMRLSEEGLYFGTKEGAEA